MERGRSDGSLVIRRKVDGPHAFAPVQRVEGRQTGRGANLCRRGAVESRDSCWFQHDLHQTGNCIAGFQGHAGLDDLLGTGPAGRCSYEGWGDSRQAHDSSSFEG